MMTLEQLGITKEDLIDRAVASLLEDVRESCVSQIVKEVTATLKAKMEFKVDEVVEETARATFDPGFTPVDTWGKPKGPTTAKNEMGKAFAVQISNTVMKQFGIKFQ